MKQEKPQVISVKDERRSTAKPEDLDTFFVPEAVLEPDPLDQLSDRESKNYVSANDLQGIEEVRNIEKTATAARVNEIYTEIEREYSERVVSEENKSDQDHTAKFSQLEKSNTAPEKARAAEIVMRKIWNMTELNSAFLKNYSVKDQEYFLEMLIRVNEKDFSEKEMDRPRDDSAEGLVRRIKYARKAEERETLFKKFIELYR